MDDARSLMTGTSGNSPARNGLEHTALLLIAEGNIVSLETRDLINDEAEDYAEALCTRDYFGYDVGERLSPQDAVTFKGLVKNLRGTLLDLAMGKVDPSNTLNPMIREAKAKIAVGREFGKRLQKPHKK